MGEASIVPSATPVITLRVTVRAPDLESFIDRYSKHIDGDRIFIFTKNPQAVGTRVRFTLQLESGEQLIHGKGTVTRVQNEGNARRPPGMELVFVPLDDRSQTLVDFMLASRVADAPPIVRAVAGVPKPPPLPLPPLPLPPPPQPPTAPPALTLAPAPPATEAATDAATSDSTARDTTTSNTSTSDASTSDAPTSDPTTPDSTTSEAQRPSSIATRLAELASTTVKADVTPGPAPAFAEKWREPLPPGEPAASADQNVPANPFSEVSDGAIEYFVEWSLEQSIGARAEPTASFSDVAMALPRHEVAPHVATLSQRRLWAIGGGCFAAGLTLGLVMVPLLRAPRATAAVAAAPALPVAPAPPVAALAPPVAPAAAVEHVELAVVTRPPGASVRVDGEVVGVTPMVAKVVAGRHEVSVAKDRYEPQTTASEAPGHVQLTLKRPMATLHIVSTPPDALVTIEGVQRGRTPADVRVPAFESYAVDVARAGARTWHRSIYVRSTTSTITATLANAPKKPQPKLGQR
jgi:uncharacterized protein (TIGR02266 family)